MSEILLNGKTFTIDSDGDLVIEVENSHSVMDTGKDCWHCVKKEHLPALMKFLLENVKFNLATDKPA